MTSETFAKAKIRIMSELVSEGWEVKSGLKIPYAMKGNVRIWFKPQAIYWGFGNNFGDARSMHIEIRGVPAKKILEAVEYYTKTLGEEVFPFCFWWHRNCYLHT